ncbi:MAG: AEC family transporter [bacterium]
MQIINSLAPVFTVIALGAILRKSNFLSANFIDGMIRLTYWVGLPCLLFYKIASATSAGARTGQIFLVLVVGMISSLILAYAFGRLLRMPGESIGTFIQASFRGNLAFIGLPVILYGLSGKAGSEMQDLNAAAVLVLAAMVPIYNLLSVVVLLVGRKRLDWPAFKKMLLQIVTNPLLIACLIGILFLKLAWGLPEALWRSSMAIGQMSLPLALLSIGGTLANVELRGRWHLPLVASLIKVGAAPTAGYFAAGLLGLASGEARIALIYLACPTAAASFVLADQLGGDRTLAASAVLLSTLLAMASLGIAIAIRF